MFKDAAQRENVKKRIFYISLEIFLYPLEKVGYIGFQYIN